VLAQRRALAAGQPAELHLEARLRLSLGEANALAELSDEERLLSLVRADELDDLVDVVVRDLEALEDVRALFRPAEIVLGATADDLPPMVDGVLEDLLERERLRMVAAERSQ